MSLNAAVNKQNKIRKTEYIMAKIKRELHGTAHGDGMMRYRLGAIRPKKIGKS